ncbi:RagB/SusD family nutrient uptake outer membrane protein [Pseudozobellia sp. WGM2]|uniref:RagB/SusD family nutrient uptake outer membrane protein n=1 Tax=Pseudozobellia sp. WGM2 TaxID=2787625 RepID=UPI001AE0E82D|nr:RagB/SusD family nutrient uptake outer membrane protein [Pseudozobellia sp. WGM2]
MIKNILFTILAVTLLVSCTDDLDTEPRIEQSLDNLLDSDPNATLGILGKLYGGLALHGIGIPGGDNQQADIAGDDPGETVFFRSMWNMQELTTDIAKNRWGDGGLDPLTTASDWSPTNKFFGYLYNRSYFNIAQTNNFILDVQKADEPEAELFVAEARFLRALYYYYLMDMFGGVVIVTEDDGVTGVRRPKNTRTEVFEFIESELLAIEESIIAVNEYGRANKAAVHFLLAKIYLNAEVYTGTGRYADALTYSEKVIAESSFTLDDDYQSIFQGDNHTSTEIIFPIVADRNSVQSFGTSTYLTNGSLGDTTMPISEFGNSESWFGHRCTPAVYGLFGDLETTNDGRALFWTEGHTYEMTDYRTWENGYPTIKFQNQYATGNSGESNFSDTDIPLFRLSDAYLMYAEAFFRGGGGSATQAVDYINALRQRAFGDTSGNIVEADITEQFLIDERARELYYEGHRRQDLIRFNRFTGGGYLWPWKGNVLEGTAIPEHYNLFPFPLEALQANPLLEQNPGYTN